MIPSCRAKKIENIGLTTGEADVVGLRLTELNFRHVKFEDFMKFPIGNLEWVYSSLHSGKLFRLEI